MSKVEEVINSFTKIDEELFESLEESLILADIGGETSFRICEKLRAEVKRTGTTDVGISTFWVGFMYNFTIFMSFGSI